MTSTQKLRRSGSSSTNGSSSHFRFWILGLVCLVSLGSVLVWQQNVEQQYKSLATSADFLTTVSSSTSSLLSGSNLALVGDRSVDSTVAMSFESAYQAYLRNPLSIPQGEAPSLPSIRVTDPALDKTRKYYGGVGDKTHLGGFTDIDLHGISPSVWKHMITSLGVRSVLDVGCGRGISTTWFLLHGVDALCVEGSHDAVDKTMLPSPREQVIEHDFSRGPWWPARTYDAAWMVEFLEHIPVQWQHNYVTALRKCALIFATSSRWGGWHHVEVHQDPWWIRKFELLGFYYDDGLTQEIRKIASKEKSANIPAFQGQTYNAQHLWLTVKVFVNPVVAALPEHAHLFPEYGCIENYQRGKPLAHRPCEKQKKETPTDPALVPLTLNPEMDEKWEDLVNSHIEQKDNTKKQK